MTIRSPFGTLSEIGPQESDDHQPVLISRSTGNLAVETGGGVRRVSVDISAKQMRTLHTAPITIVPAPGAGKIISIIGAQFQYHRTADFAGAQFFGLAYSAVDNPNGIVFAFGDGSAIQADLQASSPLVVLAGVSNYAITVSVPDDTSLLFAATGVPAAFGPIEANEVSTTGAGYDVGDTGSLPGASADATYIVDTVDESGGVLTYTLTNPGTGYETAIYETTNDGAQPGIGTGFSIHVTQSAFSGDQLAVAGEINVHELVSGGSNYSVGDYGTLPGDSADASYLVTSVGTNGAVTGYEIPATANGTAYFQTESAATEASIGHGTGFTIEIFPNTGPARVSVVYTIEDRISTVDHTERLGDTNDLSAGAWVLGHLTAAIPVVTGNDGVAPDGTTTAAKIALPACASGFTTVSQVADNLIGEVEFSILLRGAVGGEQINVMTYVNDASLLHQRVTLSDVWERYRVRRTITSFDDVVGCAVGTDLRSNTQAATAACVFHAWGASLTAV